MNIVINHYVEQEKSSCQLKNIKDNNELTRLIEAGYADVKGTTVTLEIRSRSVTIKYSPTSFDSDKWFAYAVYLNSEDLKDINLMPYIDSPIPFGIRPSLEATSEN